MANMIYPLVSTETSVNNPIYIKIANDVAKILQINSDSLRVLYNSMEVTNTDVKTNVKKGSGVNTPTTMARSRFSVNISDEFNNELIGNETVTRIDSYPIFHDKDIGIVVAPIYTNNSILFEFKYISTSKIEIDQIRDRLRTLLSRDMGRHTHDVDYTMILPYEFNDFVRDVYEIKSKLYPCTLEEYTQLHSTNRLHEITDMKDDSNKMYGVKEIIVDIHGEFDFEASPPERVTNNSKNQHGIAFTYRVDMAFPKQIYMKFPIAFCNSLMRDEYLIPIEDNIIKRNQIKSQSAPIYLNRSSTAINNLKSSAVHSANVLSSIYPINVPLFDEYFDTHPPFGFSTIMSMLIIMKEEGGRYLFNLNDLGDYYIPKPILEYIKDNRRLVTTYQGAFIFLGLEQVNRHMGSDYLIINENLDVRLKGDINLTNAVRVTINFCTDLNYLKENIVNRILNDTTLFKHYLKTYVELSRDMIAKNSLDLDMKNNVLNASLIRKIYDLYDTNQFMDIRDIIILISLNPVLSMNLGYILHMSFGNLLFNLCGEGIAYLESNGSVQPMSLDPKIADEQRKIHFNQLDRNHGGYSGRNFVDGRWIGGPNDNKNNGDNRVTDEERPPNGWFPGQDEPDHTQDNGNGDYDRNPGITIPGEDGRIESKLFGRRMKTVNDFGIIAHRSN